MSKAAKTLNIILLPALVLVWVIPVGVAPDAGLIALTSKSLVSSPTRQETRILPPTNNIGDDKDPLLSGWFNGAPEGEKEVWRQYNLNTGKEFTVDILRLFFRLVGPEASEEKNNDA